MSSTQGRDLSVLIPFIPRRPEQALPYAGLVTWTKAVRLWQGQALVMEPHQTFTALAGSGFRTPVGLGVTLMPLRHPYEAAIQARSVALATGHPVLAAYGPGSTSLQNQLLGSPYKKPLTVAREYITAVRGFLDGGIVEADGEHYTFQAQLAPAAAPRVDVGLGVLRPGMARLAGEVADAAVTWLTPPAYIRNHLVPAIREGMDKAGRTVMPKITAMVPVALGRDETPARDIAIASNAAHMQAPHYRDMLNRAGVDVSGSDLAAIADGVVASHAFVSGQPQQVLEQIAAYYEAGVDEVVLNTTGVHKTFGGNAAMDDLKTIISTWKG
ncbi:LLM class flavin-dependent oxidoreductase [Streptomyces tubercidicus]